jgi:osmotically-inducible protein OsmY
MSDQSLERAVMTAIADNDLVHADELAVEVHGDYVILRGTVGSLMQRAEALRTARRVPGVDAVDALVHVRPLGGNGLADADTEAAVMAALIDDGGVSASSIEVDAHGDAVTLSGLVDARSQRDRAKRIALRVGGVAQVHNELRVLSIVSPDEVAERVTDAIGVDAELGADRISVGVRDNDVTLSGMVGSPDHREIALAAAARAPGVVSVRDELTVRERS